MSVIIVQAACGRVYFLGIGDFFGDSLYNQAGIGKNFPLYARVLIGGNNLNKGIGNKYTDSAEQSDVYYDFNEGKTMPLTRKAKSENCLSFVVLHVIAVHIP